MFAAFSFMTRGTGGDREDRRHAGPARVHEGGLHPHPATSSDSRGMGGADPGSGSGKRSITARRWRWASTRTTRIIRRRLQQKMEFVSNDIAAQVEPTDADSAAPISNRTRTRSRRAAVHVPPGVSEPGEARREPRGRRREAAGQLNQAGGKADLACAGRSVFAGPRVQRASGRRRCRQFGEQFATKLVELPAGRWQGPVESGYGLHLVLVSRASRRATAGAFGGARRGAPRVGKRPSDARRTRSSTRSC